jgi:hypothetical protein
MEIDSSSAKARAELGALLRRVGSSDEAAELLEEALRRATSKVQQNPKLGAAHGELAFNYAQ